MKGQDIKKKLKKSGISFKDIAERANMTPQSLNNIFKVSDIKVGVLEKLAEAINENLYYFFENTDKDNIQKKVSSKSDAVIIPLYNAETSAGTGSLLLSDNHIIDELQVPFARQGDLALSIVGDSMTPALHCGDIAIIRQISNWSEYLDYGNIFIIVTNNDIYCKIISKNEDKNFFTLKSYNLNYNEFEISKKLITQVYKVIATISQKCY